MLDVIIQYAVWLSINHALSLTNQNQLIAVRGGGGPITHSRAQFTWTHACQNVLNLNPKNHCDVNVQIIGSSCYPVRKQIKILLDTIPNQFIIDLNLQVNTRTKSLPVFLLQINLELYLFFFFFLFLNVSTTQKWLNTGEIISLLLSKLWKVCARGLEAVARVKESVKVMRYTLRFTKHL